MTTYTLLLNNAGRLHSGGQPHSRLVLRRLGSLGLAAGLAMVMGTQTTPARAQELHADLCLHGCPSGSPATNDVVIRDIYILSSNDMTKFADWVAYRVTKDTIGTTEGRVWRPDPWLADNETLEPNDYRGANAALKTDRGHQAPLASFTSTKNWETTNYLSNITPQKSALNQGAWVKLETLCERWPGNRPPRLSLS